MRLTAPLLARILPSARASDALKYAPLLTEFLPKYGIDTPQRVAAFLGTIDVESAALGTVKEGGTEAYFNQRYGPATKAGQGIGNTQPGDGARYAGRGLIQITGRYNYAQVGKALGLDLIARPELLEEPRQAVQASAWWWNRRNLNALADSGNMDAITKAVRGALGKEAQQPRRVATYRRALDVLGAPGGAPGGAMPVATLAVLALAIGGLAWLVASGRWRQMPEVLFNPTPLHLFS